MSHYSRNHAPRVYLETERLVLRGWTSADRPGFASLNRDPEVMRYFPAPLSESESDALLTRIEQGLERQGYGLFAATEKTNGGFLGFIGLNRATFKSDFTPCVEVGWRLMRAVWGRGFATEGARACLEFARQELKLPEVYSFTARSNARSIAVMRRIGLNFAGEFDHPDVDANNPLRRNVLYRTDWT